MQYLIIDGMLSVAGDYLDLKNVGLSADLTNRIASWLIAYESAHYSQFGDKAVNDRLDQEGIAIAMSVQKERPGVKVEYFSNAQMRKLRFDLS